MVKDIHSLWKNEYWRSQGNKVCKKCRAERKQFGYFEDEKSPIFPGFNNELKKKLDIFFVLESLGKKEKDEEWPKTPENAVKDLREYYLEKKPPKTFHQYCIRQILEPFSSRSYIVSDVVKCFVIKKGKNFDIAAEKCSPFLEEQIFHYRPEIIVAIGRTALRTISSFRDCALHEEIENLKHGMAKEVHLKRGKGRKMRSIVLYCIFPGGWTADSWIEHDGHKPVVNKLEELFARK